MSWPVTHAKNLSQHLGQVVLDMKQKWCTLEKKQANNIQAEWEREEAAAAHKGSIKYLANIISWAEKKEEDLLTKPHKPRSKLRDVLKPSVDPTSMSKYKEDMNTISVDAELGEEDGSRYSEGHKEGDEDGDADGYDNGDLEEQELTVRNTFGGRCDQKTFTQDAIQAAQDKDLEVLSDKDVHDADSWNECVDDLTEPEKEVTAIV